MLAELPTLVKLITEYPSLARRLDGEASERNAFFDPVRREEFSGLEVMCLMHAGFRQADPSIDTGMDLDEPLAMAKKHYAARKTEG